MSNANGRKGSMWERQIMDYLREFGYDVERLRTKGTDDEGDLVVKDGFGPIIIEAKNVQRMNLADFVRQAETEADNYCRNRGISRRANDAVVVIKRRNHPVGKAYVVQTLDQFFGIGE